VKNLTILQINDLHGYVAPHPEIFDLGHEGSVRSGGGVARIATLIRTIRRDVGNSVVALDNGDTFHGTMAAVRTQGEALMASMSALGLDGMTVHWEFAYGLDRLGEIAARLPYPVLAANCHLRNSAGPFTPFTLIERGGVRLAVIGLAAVVARNLLPPDVRETVDVTMGEVELRAQIPSLRHDHGAQLIVVLSHLGFPQDCKLAATVPGIDILLSGHTHNRLHVPVVINDTVIMQSGAHGSFVGRLDVTVGRDGLADWSHALVPIDDALEPDPALSTVVSDALAPFAHARVTVVGETTCTLHRYSMFESTMDNLLLDATAAAAGTTVALSNGWRYGAPVAAGPLTEWDLWNIVPADPPVSIVTLTGRQLRTLLEQNVEATFACDPWDQKGGYLKRCRGIEMLLKLENPAGHRIQQLTVQGDQLGDEQTVDAAFLGEQAVPPTVGTNRRSVGISAVHALEQYVRAQQTVSPAPHGNIKVT
jgi:2',3'-cyclic-nucleotide 2'-phosphodiesterase (5'-nucleotidase family)